MDTNQEELQIEVFFLRFLSALKLFFKDLRYRGAYLVINIIIIITIIIITVIIINNIIIIIP